MPNNSSYLGRKIECHVQLRDTYTLNFTINLMKLQYYNLIIIQLLMIFTISLSSCENYLYVDAISVLVLFITIYRLFESYMSSIHMLFYYTFNCITTKSYQYFAFTLNLSCITDWF